MAVQYICHNGNFLPEDEPVVTHRNRAFRYGDALFETIHCLGTSPQFLELHWKRLSQGMKILRMEPGNFSMQIMGAAIEKMLNKNRIFKGARIRLTVYRDEGGFYTPTVNSSSWLMESTELENEHYLLNNKGLRIVIYDNIHKPVHVLSNLKTSNALIFVMAGIFRKENSLDDCLLLNQFGRVVESISSNVFIVKEDNIKTPPLSEGCIAGVMRYNIMKVLADEGFSVQERGILESDVYDADEIFLTNAISGITWLGAYKDRRYFNFTSKKILNTLNERTFEPFSK